MAKKKNINNQDIIGYYMEYVLTHDAEPKSVYAFAKYNNFEEAKFYEYFNSFQALEESVFEVLFENTISILHKSEDYKSFDAKNKLLSFYFTFFENLTANRSYVVYALEHEKNNMKSLRKLAKLKKHFTNYIAMLNIETLDLKNDKLKKIRKRSLKETAWLQLLVTIKFWLEDTSTSFEKTDVFIEKSVRASFDLINTTPLHSLIDFGKFLITEKMHMN